MTDSAWHDRVLGWVRERLLTEPGPDRASAADPLEANLGMILETARLTMEALNRFSDQVRVEDRNKYEFVKQRLPEIIAFEEFSLAEYTIHLPDGRTPGIRLWLSADGFDRVLQVLYFPDVLAWRVDREGRRVREMILEMDLSSASPGIRGGDAPLGATSDWRDGLALSLSRAAGRDPAEIVSGEDSL